MDVEIEPVRLGFREPVRTAFGELRERTVLVLRLRDAGGFEGVGEAAPLEPYDGVSLAAVREQVDACRPLLAAGDGAARADLLARAAEVAVLPQALAAIDVALWDLEGRRSGRPVWALLGATDPPAPVPVNATLGAEDRAGAAAQAAAAVRAGFRCLKVKVGIGDDAGRLAAVRAAAGPDVALRIDANGAWATPAEALAALRALAPVGIEWCEEPVHGADAIAEVAARSPVPVALDESATAGPPPPGVAAVALKLSRYGGITGGLAAARAARAVGVQPYLTSTFDGPVGIAAALHVAAALAPLPPCGLATLGLFAGVGDPFPPRAGAIGVPAGPGLGV